MPTEAVPVPTGTVLSYNGYTFGAYVKTSVTREPVMSGDDRVVKYWKVTIHVSGWLTQEDADNFVEYEVSEIGDTLDAFMVDLRRTLAPNGKRLRYVSKGYGIDMDVNSDESTHRDVANGPRPGRLTWRPLGGAPDGCHGAFFEWEISTCIVECESFSANPGPDVLLECSFTVKYDVDEAGLVVITHSAVMQIPSSLRSDGRLIRNIEDAITGRVRKPPDGFIRRHSRQLSADRATCRLTIVDKQLEVPPPNDCVEIEMRQRIRQLTAGSPVWNATISGRVRLSPTASKYLAQSRFFNIACQRITYARRKAVSTQGGPLRTRRGVAIGTVEIEEDLFKNEAHFVVNYRILGAYLYEVARVSGLWQPLFGANNPPQRFPWTAQSHRESLGESAQKFRGYVGAQFSNDNEVILHVCPDAGPAIPTEVVANNGPQADEYGLIIEIYPLPPTESDMEQLDAQGNFLNNGGALNDTGDDLFPPETSWLQWTCTAERIVEHNRARHKPLSGTVTPRTPIVDPMGTAEDVAEDKTAPENSWDADVPDIFQRAASPSLMLRLTGNAVRVGHRVNPPRLVTYGGRELALAREHIVERTTGIGEGAVVFRTDWVLEYLIDGPPVEVPVLANPLLGTSGSNGVSGPLEFQDPIQK